MNHRPNAVAQITFFFVLWLFSIALIVPIPFAALLTIWWLARTYAQRKAENALIRNELETRNMVEVGKFFG